MTKPIRRIRCGPIVASIWEHTKVVKNALVTFHTISLERVYTKDQKWKYSKSFGVEDLLKVALVAKETYKSLRLTVGQPEDTPAQVEEHGKTEGSNPGDSGFRKSLSDSHEQSENQA